MAYYSFYVKQLGNPPFNGQKIRTAEFEEIIDAVSVTSACETGTSFGRTTEYLAGKISRPIFSSEVIPHSYYCAKLRLRKDKHVSLCLGDSRDFLTRITQDRAIDLGAAPFFYLDAHWYEDLPLRGEIEAIATNVESFLILIDDFKVPDDPGYGFDSYSSGTLELAYIADLVDRFGLNVYFSSRPSTEETGFKRGWVYLSRGKSIENSLKGVSSIRVFAEVI